MDIMSFLGVILALIAIIGGNILEGGHTSSLVQMTALLIVLGGTFGAVMLQTPLKIFIQAMRMMPWVFISPKNDSEVFVDKIVEWSNISRKEGLLGLETVADAEEELFARKALQLLIDGNEPEIIRSVLEIEMDSVEHNQLQSAKVFDAMGGYSPTIGIIGAVMGLIHVMHNLADPSKLGSGIAVAFVATIYGVGFANLFFLPVANKLKFIINQRVVMQEVIVEGVIAISEGENPRNIESKLRGYLH